MSINVLTIIILITVVVSVNAFNNRSIMERFMFIPYNVKHYKNHIRTIGHILIHANWAHLFFNMFALYMLGDIFLLELSIKYGFAMAQAHFVVLYVLGALFATVIPYLRHQDNPAYRSLGASGAVSAVVFAFILWNPTAQLGLIFLPTMPAFIFGPLYLLAEFLLDRRGGTGIAHDAHIGGALFGIIYVLIINIDKGKEFINAILNYW